MTKVGGALALIGITMLLAGSFIVDEPDVQQCQIKLLAEFPAPCFTKVEAQTCGCTAGIQCFDFIKDSSPRNGTCCESTCCVTEKWEPCDADGETFPQCHKVCQIADSKTFNVNYGTCTNVTVGFTVDSSRLTDHFECGLDDVVCLQSLRSRFTIGANVTCVADSEEVSWGTPTKPTSILVYIGGEIGRAHV